MSLTPFWSIVSCVKALILIGTLLRDSSRRVAVTVISAISALLVASALAAASAASAARPSDPAAMPSTPQSNAAPSRTLTWMSRDRSVEFSYRISNYSETEPQYGPSHRGLLFLYPYKLAGVRKISNVFRARHKPLTARVRGASFTARILHNSGRP